MSPPLDPDWPLWLAFLAIVLGLVVGLTAWVEGTRLGERFIRWLESRRWMP